MSDLTTGWRKRQIALDIKADNARELGLDYVPTKTVMEQRDYWLEKFAELVEAAARADEREECAKLCEEWLGPTKDREIHIATAIRARGQA